jgi:hypothetical protein
MNPRQLHFGPRRFAARLFFFRHLGVAARALHSVLTRESMAPAAAALEKHLTQIMRDGKSPAVTGSH